MVFLSRHPVNRNPTATQAALSWCYMAGLRAGLWSGTWAGTWSGTAEGRVRAGGTSLAAHGEGWAQRPHGCRCSSDSPRQLHGSG